MSHGTGRPELSLEIFETEFATDTTRHAAKSVTITANNIPLLAISA
jgi:hypothetical protein